MIEPPKLAVFLIVVTAHLAVLAFGFPDMRTVPVEAGSESSSSPSANLAVVDQKSPGAGSAAGADTLQHDHVDAVDHQNENAYGHGAAPRESDGSALPESSATPAGHRSEAESDGQVDTVPALEEHRRQHGHGDQDHDGESYLVDPERIAHVDGATKPPTVNQLAEDVGKSSEVQRPDTTKLAGAPKPPTVKPLPTAADESKPDVPARPTPVQMIIPEKPVEKSSAPPKLKPVAKPSTPTTASKTPQALPVANASNPATPTSDRAGSGRMKNLRPIKKP